MTTPPVVAQVATASQPSGFPSQQSGRLYLTEGGVEPELMFKCGRRLPEFAMYPLLEDPAAMVDVRRIYADYLDVAARHGFCALMGGMDYRASPDWAAKLGYSLARLEEAELANVEFLREMAAAYHHDIDTILINGFVGPRGDAYTGEPGMTQVEAEDYHSVQLTTLKSAGVDLAWAFALGSEVEALGVVLAARAVGLPVAVSFIVRSDGRLRVSGASLAQAVAYVDAGSDSYAEFFGLNCSHPVEFAPALTEAPWLYRLRALRPNASKTDKMELCQIGYLEEGDPVELGELMGELAQRFGQIDIWGGCCGTTATHLGQIATTVAAARS